MTSAVAQFFRIGELVTLVGAFLDKEDLSSYMRTCRFFQALCALLLYHSLELNHIRKYRSLTQSLEAIQAFERNKDFVRHIFVVQRVLNVFHQQTIAEPAINSTMSDTRSAPNSSTTLSDSISPLVNTVTIATGSRGSLVTPPHLVNLTRLCYRFDRFDSLNSAIFKLICRSGGNPVVQLSSLLYRSPCLRMVQLQDVLVKTESSLRLMTCAIAGCSSLQSLRLELLVLDVPMDRVLVAVFFSCPQSVRELQCHLNDCVRPRHQVGPGIIDSPTDTSDVPLMRQHAPLSHLTGLLIGGDFHPRIEDLFAMLMNCPKVVTLEIPRIRLPFQTSLVSPFVAKNCPNLRNLAQREVSKDNSQCIIMSIVPAMTEGMFKSLEIRGFNDPEDRLCSTLQRYFESLVCIYFDGCENVSSRAILTVLCSCPVLEEFVVSSSNSFPECFITLEDASAYNWVATRLQTLCLIVYMKDIDYLDLCFDWGEYTSQDQLTLLQLDGFYKQIGALVDLRDLDLRLCTCLKEGENSDDGSGNEDDDGGGRIDGGIPEYFHRTLPGLMTLGGNVKNKDRGWLQCLSGLSKLEFLSGSINVMVETDKCVMNQNDVDWIATHWPKLQEAHFVCQNLEGSPGCLVWLQKELPGLCLFP